MLNNSATIEQVVSNKSYKMEIQIANKSWGKIWKNFDSWKSKVYNLKVEYFINSVKKDLYYKI